MLLWKKVSFGDKVKNTIDIQVSIYCFVTFDFILLSMDKDKDGQDVHQELTKLKTKIQKAREQISNMPGIDCSPQEQQQQLSTLREQVHTKNQLLQKYKSLCMFDVPKAS